MKPFLLFFCTVTILIMVVACTGANTGSTNDNNQKLTEQITTAAVTSSQSGESSSDTTGKVMSISVVFMILVVLTGLIILIGAILGITAYKCKNKYFPESGVEDRLNKINFYINKHTIFRRFAMLYSIVHYLLQIISIVTTLITIYMVVDTSDKLKIQIIFLLLSAVFSSLGIILRFDKVGGCYAQAMRVLETAILTYLAGEDDSLLPLVDANKEAEEIIENNFF